MSHLYVAADQETPQTAPQTDQEILASAIVALRRCQQTGIDVYARLAIEANTDMLERHLADMRGRRV